MSTSTPYWLAETDQGSIELLASPTAPTGVKQSVPITGALNTNSVDNAIFNLKGAALALTGHSRGSIGIPSLLVSNAVSKAEKTGQATLYNAATGTEAALAAAGLYAGGFGGLAGSAFAGPGAADAAATDAGAAGAGAGAGGLTSSLANNASTLLKDATIGSILGGVLAWGPGRVLEVVIGLALLFFGIKAVANVGQGS